MESTLKFAIVFLTLWNTYFVHCYKPVVLIHGIFDKKDSLESLADRIRTFHPGTEVTLIDKLHGFKSLSPMWFQVSQFKKVLDPIMRENPDGVHLIGFSQGGLVARGIIQSSNNHNIQNFISLSSPQAGQYGDKFLHIIFPTRIKHQAWKLFYSKFGQETSIGNYWRDPHHIHKFLSYSDFLAKVDNCVKTRHASEYKKNFAKLKKVVLIGGPDDGIIMPWQSSQFGYYNKNETVVDMMDRLEYIRDLFGLRTLDESGRVVRVTVPGVGHRQWHRNTTVIDKYILPYLD